MKWQDPPENGASNKGITDMVREAIPELRANPGKWALLSDDVNVGSVPRWTMLWPDIQFRTVSKEGVREGRVAVYARAKVTDA